MGPKRKKSVKSTGDVFEDKKEASSCSGSASEEKVTLLPINTKLIWQLQVSFLSCIHLLVYVYILTFKLYSVYYVNRCIYSFIHIIILIHHFCTFVNINFVLAS